MREGPVLVTGHAGFIGFHLARALLAAGKDVVGVDGMTPFYDVALKQARRDVLAGMSGFRSHDFMLEDRDRLAGLVREARPTLIIHLAAQAGVRYSLENPSAYVDSNVVGTLNLLEACRATPPDHLMIASTSSVYGDGKTVPYVENAETSQPVSLYAATKKAAEVMAHSYAHLFDLPTTIFRFFTVYGPWGRPDMALFKFTSAILEGREIEIYGDGRMSRDFTFVDDLVAGILGLAAQIPPSPEVSSERDQTLSPVAPFRILNIGASQPVDLETFVSAIEDAVGLKARRRYLPMQPGDVRRTYADTAALRHLVTLPPPTPLRIGVRAFVDWYRSYYGAPLAEPVSRATA